ncbi:MAG: hypothetical protein RMM29_09015 [Planctomycetota bacterium]|nr:hypothetical protein [Planctomycetota bacterium]MCX8040615.1 hypothetical protein [Planctomycetota bacterium]MDW8373767.1 hypothetical protein [Planctomycetota bacterium]
MAHNKDTIEQEELDNLLRIHGLLSDERSQTGRSLIDELHDAILDSGKLSLSQWRELRERLREIEALIPTIDLIIRLKERRG